MLSRFRMEQNLDSHYDTDLANHCRTGLRCLSVTSPLFHEYDKQDRGSSDTSDGGARDSDIKIYKTFTKSTRDFLADRYGYDAVQSETWLSPPEFAARFVEAKGQGL
ncbi:hypothetical protein KVT40_007312 [Elsinoe batatas]|uniref:Uncharacterized protein n=1 Tax=Elsinoe batatas TaxID=2601811 RepID=A0A8K0KVV6_9PEZI|nr:hypothetical protein KVT40_007312 [Elsinoe batatas]